MVKKLDDTRIKKIIPIKRPYLLQEELPSSASMEAHIHDSRSTIADIINGRDKRLLVIVGPCSIHDAAAALDYASRLRELSKEIADVIYVVMRVYFEKPRTTVGWKGFINDPDLNDSNDINKGLYEARNLLLNLNDQGIVVATEFLDSLTPQFIADLVSWAAIGARTTESPLHRHLASGLSMPVGFKNGTSGDVKVAVDAVYAAYHPHSFLGVTNSGDVAIFATTGNEDSHIILRGGSVTGPNFDAASVAVAQKMLEHAKLQTKIIVDCSHGNSGKDYTKQHLVLEHVMDQLQEGQENIAGIMLESNIKEGNQALRDKESLVYGQSITDACINWQETEDLLIKCARRLRG